MRAAPDDVRARALMAAGDLAHYQGDEAHALPWLEEGMALTRAFGDLYAIVDAGYVVGVAAEDRGDYAGAPKALTEALENSRAGGKMVIATWCLIHLGIVAFA